MVCSSADRFARRVGRHRLSVGHPGLCNARSDGPSRTELAVEKIAGLLALAVGIGLLGPLVFVVMQGDIDGVETVVIAVLSGITLVAGVMLLLGQRSGDGLRAD